MNTVSFKTVGCRLNQAETAQIAAQFEALGWSVVPFGEACDACVVHTCAVTAKAEKDSFRLARSVKRKEPSTTVVLAGCAAEIRGEELLRESGADFVAGQGDKFRLAELISGFRVQGSGFRKERSDPLLPYFQTTRALVKVQDGCDFGCAYCIVPFARGRARSRPFVEIIDEVKKLADHGYREVVLTGANMGCYKDGSRGLVHLLERIEAIQRIDRIRLSSIEVSTTERAIIDHMAESSKLCRYIHIPLQSGDDRILSAMGRRYTVQEYRRLIEYAVKKIPLLGLGTDLLAGLPGEDKAAFANTVRMVKDLPFSNLHVFPYSKRPGTRAASMPRQVHDHEKKRRTALLIELGEKMRRSFAEKFIGRKVSVLVEEVAPSTGSPRLNSLADTSRRLPGRSRGSARAGGQAEQAGQAEDGNGTGWTGEYVEAKVTACNLKTNQVIEFIPVTYDGGALR